MFGCSYCLPSKIQIYFVLQTVNNVILKIYRLSVSPGSTNVQTRWQLFNQLINYQFHGTQFSFLLSKVPASYSFSEPDKTIPHSHNLFSFSSNLVLSCLTPRFCDASVHLTPMFCDASVHLTPMFCDASVHLTPRSCDASVHLTPRSCDAYVHLTPRFCDALCAPDTQVLRRSLCT